MMIAPEGPPQRREQRQRPPQQEEASWSRQGNGGAVVVAAAAGGGDGGLAPGRRQQQHHNNHSHHGRGRNVSTGRSNIRQNQQQRLQQPPSQIPNNRGISNVSRVSLLGQQQQQQQSSVHRLAKAWQSLEDDEELHDLKVASLVGDDAGRFVETNRVVLAKRSLVFRKMLYGNFRESKSEIIHLEYPLKVIQVVIKYIYTNTLVMDINDGNVGSSISGTAKSCNATAEAEGGVNDVLLHGTRGEAPIGNIDRNNSRAPMEGRDVGAHDDNETHEEDDGEHNLILAEGQHMQRSSTNDAGLVAVTMASSNNHNVDDEEEDEEHRCMVIIEEARFLVQVAICAEYLELAHLGELVYDALMMDLLDVYPHLVACAVVDETLDAAAASSYDGHKSHVRRMHDMALRVIQGQPQFCLLGLPDPSTHVDEFVEAIGRQAAAEASAMAGGQGGPDGLSRVPTEAEAEESIFFNRNNLNQGGASAGSASVVGGRYASYAEAAAEHGVQVGDDADTTRSAGVGSTSAAGTSSDNGDRTSSSGDVTMSIDVANAAAAAGGGPRGSFSGAESNSELGGAIGCGVLLLRAEALSKVIAMQPMNCDEIVLFRAIKLWYDFHRQEEEEEEDENERRTMEEENPNLGNSKESAKQTSSEDFPIPLDGDSKPKAIVDQNPKVEEQQTSSPLKKDDEGNAGTNETKDRSSRLLTPSSSRKRLMKHALLYDSGRSVQGGTGAFSSSSSNSIDGWNNGSAAAAQKIVRTSISLKRIKPSHLRDEVIPSRLAKLQDLNEALLHQALLAEQCQMIDVRRLPVWSSSGTEIVTASSQSGSSAYLKCPPMTEDGRLGQHRALQQQQQQSQLSPMGDQGNERMLGATGVGGFSLVGDSGSCVYRWSVEVLKSDGKILMGIFGGPDPLNPTFKAHVKGDGRRFKFNQREAPTIQEVEACQYLKFSAGSVIYFTLDFDQHDICLTAKVIHQPTEMVCEEEILFGNIRDEFSPDDEIILHPGVYCRSPCSIRLTSFH